jgi:hypothetical protein
VVAAAIGAIGLRIPHWYTPELGIGIDELEAIHVQLALRMLGAREKGGP